MIRVMFMILTAVSLMTNRIPKRVLGNSNPIIDRGIKPVKSTAYS